MAAYRRADRHRVTPCSAGLDFLRQAGIAPDAQELTEKGHILVSRIGPWTEPKLPLLGQGDARLMVLTPSGPHFGQGPFSALGSDPLARPILDAACQLLNRVLSVADKTPLTGAR